MECKTSLGPPTHRFAFGEGSAILGADGAVVEVLDPRRRESLLLREAPDCPEAAMHRPERRWGKGFLIAGGSGARFDARPGCSASRAPSSRTTSTSPAHEVNYEQSIVAPLLDLLITAHRLDPDLIPPAALLTRLEWLTAFAADQPDVRLRHMPIRHWDGYWFGSLRLWGDVFPHYWSILSAAVYLDFPAALLPPDRVRRLREAGRAILQGNLVSFAEDGSAMCAFVYPSCVDGRPAHVADPLANDQDWALVYALRYAGA